MIENIADKEILSAIAIAITFAAFLPYIRSIIAGTTRPHVFSWIIWGITTLVVFLAQLEAKGGIGAWPIGISGLVTLFIALLAFIKRADISITLSDWLFLIAALSSLPLWYFTADPLSAVIILTTIDLLGFGPTIRKVYATPYSESLLFFSLFTIRNTLVVMALETYSLTTVLFPALIALACLLLVLLASYRRHVLSGLKKLK